MIFLLNNYKNKNIISFLSVLFLFEIFKKKIKIVVLINGGDWVVGEVNWKSREKTKMF